MELSQIKYFIEAAQLQNLSKAAHILNITQPALSKSISNLEEELGIPLFNRSGKRVTLNAYGAKFLEAAVSMVQTLDDAVLIVKNQVMNPMLCLGLFQHSKIFMCCLEDFSQKHPNVIFQLDYREIATYSIEDNEYDMLLYPRNPLFRKYKGYVVYSDKYLLAVHKSNPLANKDSVRLCDVPHEKAIFIKYGNNLFDLPYHFCINSGYNVSDCTLTNSHEIQRWLISNNRGVGFVPQSSAGQYDFDSEIALLPVMEEGLLREVMIGFRRDKHLSEISKVFSEFVRGYFGL